jgi:hypothetical protein
LPSASSPGIPFSPSRTGRSAAQRTVHGVGGGAHLSRRLVGDGVPVDIGTWRLAVGIGEANRENRQPTEGVTAQLLDIPFAARRRPVQLIRSDIGDHRCQVGEDHPQQIGGLLN